MNKLADLVERIFEGGLFLAAVVALLIAAGFVWLFVGGIAGILLNSFTAGAVIGLAVTVGVAYVLYAIGKSLW